MTLSADATFAFGSAELRPAGKIEISQLVRRLDSDKVTAIDIVGYTDRIGNPERNQLLSLRRANSVRAHLVELGVPASKISVDGRGAADPVVVCPGSNSRELVDCLAPNRRTTVTILSN
ncbi:Outer membrane protein A [compost metagenome]